VGVDDIWDALRRAGEDEEGSGNILKQNERLASRPHRFVPEPKEENVCFVCGLLEGGKIHTLR
jgi:hypothetical protein